MSSSRSSAIFFRQGRPQVPDREKTMMGSSEKLTSNTSGSSSRSSGNSPRASSTLSLTSCRAWSMSVPVTNSMLIELSPSALTERIFFSPSNPFSFFSISKHLGAEISSRLTPPKDPEIM